MTEVDGSVVVGKRCCPTCAVFSAEGTPLEGGSVVVGDGVGTGAVNAVEGDTLLDVCGAICAVVLLG